MHTSFEDAVRDYVLSGHAFRPVPTCETRRLMQRLADHAGASQIIRTSGDERLDRTHHIGGNRCVDAGDPEHPRLVAFLWRSPGIPASWVQSDVAEGCRHKPLVL